MFDLVVDALSIYATNEDIQKSMAKRKEQRETGTKHVTCTISGFEHDPRELHEIPEVRAFCRRLINLAYISYLDYATTLPWSDPLTQGSLGGLEIWLLSENLMAIEVEYTKEMGERFYKVLMEANEKADKLCGPFKEPAK